MCIQDKIIIIASIVTALSSFAIACFACLSYKTAKLIQQENKRLIDAIIASNMTSTEKATVDIPIVLDRFYKIYNEITKSTE